MKDELFLTSIIESILSQGHNHTHTCQNHTLRVKITLVRVEITILSVVYTFVRVKVTLRVEITLCTWNRTLRV
jgi:hypothetical protein